MQPTPLRRAPDRGKPFAELQRDLGSLGEVRAPSDAEEPILAPAVRVWLHSWLTEIRCADELAEVGLKARGTAILHGPPGCGKTTLAHHLSARLGLPLVIVGPETIVGSRHGESEGNVGRLFQVLGRSETPCVLFMDELEALGRKRTGRDSGGGAENARQSTLTVLLRKIEEYRGFLVGATNRPEDLDAALWRRMHMQLAIELPGPDERFAILKRYLHPFTLPDDDVDALVDATDGASPALLRQLMEGVKRLLVVNPRLNRPLGEPAVVFATIVASVSPPLEMPQPPLWADTAAELRHMAKLTWPPVRAT